MPSVWAFQVLPQVRRVPHAAAGYGHGHPVPVPGVHADGVDARRVRAAAGPLPALWHVPQGSTRCQVSPLSSLQNRPPGTVPAQSRPGWWHGPAPGSRSG